MSINTHEARPNNYTTTKLPWLYSLVSNTHWVNDKNVVVDKNLVQNSFTCTFLLGDLVMEIIEKITKKSIQLKV